MFGFSGQFEKFQQNRARNRAQRAAESRAREIEARVQREEREAERNKRRLFSNAMMILTIAAIIGFFAGRHYDDQMAMAICGGFLGLRVLIALVQDVAAIAVTLVVMGILGAMISIFAPLILPMAITILIVIAIVAGGIGWIFKDGLDSIFD